MSQATFLSPREVAAALKVSERTVRRWISAGSLPACRVGRQLRVASDALAQFTRPAFALGQERDWAALATDSFARDWGNDRDAEYDRWREHYAVSPR